MLVEHQLSYCPKLYPILGLVWFSTTTSQFSSDREHKSNNYGCAFERKMYYDTLVEGSVDEGSSTHEELCRSKPYK